MIILATSKKSFVKATEKTESVSEFTQCNKTCAMASVDPVRGIAPKIKKIQKGVNKIYSIKNVFQLNKIIIRFFLKKEYLSNAIKN